MVKAAECSTGLGESESTTGEQLESKSLLKDLWDEELHHYDQEQSNENQVNNHLAENKYLMYEYFHEFKRYGLYLYGLCMWTGKSKWKNANDYRSMHYRIFI